MLILICGMALVSCKGRKAKPMVEDGFTVGTIVTDRADQGCPVLVRIEKDGVSKLHRPISLPEQFAKDGANIKFKFRKSRARQKDCEDGMPLIVSEVSSLQ